MERIATITNKQTAAAVLSLYGGEMSEEVKLAEPTKEAIDFARKVVTTKVFAGIIIVGTVTMDTDSATVEGVLRGGHTWEQNIAKIVSAYAQQREEAAHEAGRVAGKQEERERIVGRLNARKQTAAISEERALKQDSPDWARAAKCQQEAAVFDEAIVIAREEGGG